MSVIKLKTFQNKATKEFQIFILRISLLILTSFLFYFFRQVIDS